MSFKDQYIADGIVSVFPFTFEIPITRKVDVYVQTGTSASEINDLVSPSEYTLDFNVTTGEPSTGNVIFNDPPVANSIVTITPTSETGISYKFENTQQFNANNLDSSFDETSSTNDFQIFNYLDASIRYNLNEESTKITYSNLVPPLGDRAFWRREGNEIISQDYDEFVEETAEEITDDIRSQVNAGADNTNLSADIANKPFGEDYSGDVKTIDEQGNVVSTPITPGKSAFSGAESARLWAESADPFTDAYGNPGVSAREYSREAQGAASASGGIITELYVKEATPVTRVDLIDYSLSPNEPWINVLESSFTVYVDGIKLPEPNSYSDGSVVPPQPYTVVINPNPTLADPTYIIFDPAIAANSEIYIARSEAQGDSSTMFVSGTNAVFIAATKIASRNLDNVLSFSDSFRTLMLNEIYFIGCSIEVKLVGGLVPPLPGVDLGFIWTRVADDCFVGTSGTYFPSNAGDVAGSTSEVDGHTLTQEETGVNVNTFNRIAGGADYLRDIPASPHNHGLNDLKRVSVAKFFRTA